MAVDCVLLAGPWGVDRLPSVHCLHIVESGESHPYDSKSTNLSFLVFSDPTQSIFFYFCFTWKNLSIFTFKKRPAEDEKEWGRGFLQAVSAQGCFPKLSCSGWPESSVLQRTERQRWWVLPASSSPWATCFPLPDATTPLAFIAATGGHFWKPGPITQVVSSAHMERKVLPIGVCQN